MNGERLAFFKDRLRDIAEMAIMAARVLAAAIEDLNRMIEEERK